MTAGRFHAGRPHPHIRSIDHNEAIKTIAGSSDAKDRTEKLMEVMIWI